MQQDNDDDCYVCCSRGSLVCCDECPRAFHHDCHVPSVEESPPGDTEKWICSYCSLREVQQSSRGDPLSLPELLRSDITQYLSQCHYLLLYLYKADNHRVFAPNPCHTVEGYADVIESPMWFDKVKDTLQAERYHTVGQFATDIELIFENCARFNQDNEFGEMGAKLRDVFEEEFKRVFAVD
uniref:Uncharacterized protein n=1 Tax=Lepisosteus oculatus TaxID=7918 RepID=W5N0E4_LEPOC